MIKWLFILIPVCGFSQDMSPRELDSMWNGQTIIFDDTVRCTKIEVKKWIFWKDVVQVRYLVKSYRNDRRTEVSFLYDDRRRKYQIKDIYRYWVEGIGWMKE